MSTHHLDEAEVLSDRVAFLEMGGLKCCGSPFYLKDKLGQGYKLTLTKKVRRDSPPAGVVLLHINTHPQQHYLDLCYIYLQYFENRKKLVFSRFIILK